MCYFLTESESRVQKLKTLKAHVDNSQQVQRYFAADDKALHYFYLFLTYVGEKAQTVIKGLVSLSAVRHCKFICSSRWVICCYVA